MLIILLALLAYGAIIVIDRTSSLNVFNLFCSTEPLEQENKESTFIINEDNTIHYLYENFDSYGNNQSQSLENFENTKEIAINPRISYRLVKNTYSGTYALLLEAESSNAGEIIIKKRFTAPKDLSRWGNKGFLSLWMNIENREGVGAVQITLIDTHNEKRTYTKLKNLQVFIPNFFNEDGPFPDIAYPTQLTSSDEWTDFVLASGWNFLFWRMDEHFYNSSAALDMSSIQSIEIHITLNKKITKQNIILDDIRVQDGLQKENNPLGGIWYPPHGRPQYGVYDIDAHGDDDYVLKLLNVRQSQYPSNGDHGRFISKYNTPLNFAMRVQFTLEDLAPKDERQNTWLRIMYDFDPVYDPGHDWFGAYLSLEWNKFGIVTVIPVERFFLQDKEPRENSGTPALTQFQADDRSYYQLDLLVRGQETKATLSTYKDNCFQKKKEVFYTFKRPRYNETKRYPITFEITGNVKATFYEIEVTELS